MDYFFFCVHVIQQSFSKFHFMSNNSELLCNFFVQLGVSEQQLQLIRHELYNQKAFNLQAAYEIFDRDLKGYIEEIDIVRVIEENDLKMNSGDAFYVLSLMDIRRKGCVTPETFALRISTSLKQEVSKELQRRPKSALDSGTLQLIFDFVKTLAIFGENLEASKQKLQQVDRIKLFSLIDTTNKGCANFEEIKTFLMLNGNVSVDLITHIQKALAERELLTIFPSTFCELIAPHEFIKQALQSPVFKAATSRISEITNEDWRAELERNQLIRHKILDEVAERSAKYGRTSPKSKIQELPTKRMYCTVQTDYQPQGMCKQLVQKIDNLKQTLLRHSCSSEGFNRSGQLDLFSNKTESSNFTSYLAAKTKRATEFALRNEESLTIQKARIEAKARISQIQNLARLKVFSSRGKMPSNIQTTSLNFDTQTKTKELEEERSKMILLEKELNRSKSKVKQLEKEIEVRKSTATTKFGLVSPRNPVIAAPITKRSQLLQNQASFPQYLKNKSKMINLQYERIKSKLESQKRAKGVF